MKRQLRSIKYDNFGRIHQSLRVTPAMEAGISDHVWSIKEIVSLCDERAVGFASNTKRP